MLRAPNVLGTAEVLRLACSCPTAAALPVHHVSTLSVFPLSMTARTGGEPIRESEPTPRLPR